MYCRKCGREIADRRTYCPFCGANQTKETTSFTAFLDINKKSNNKIKKTKTNKFSSLSLVCFIFAIVGVFFDGFSFIRLVPFFYFGAAFSLIALVLSFIGLKETKHNVKRGQGLAYSGLTLSLISIIFLLVFIGLYCFYYEVSPLDIK